MWTRAGFVRTYVMVAPDLCPLLSTYPYPMCNQTQLPKPAALVSKWEKPCEAQKPSDGLGGNRKEKPVREKPSLVSGLWS